MSSLVGPGILLLTAAALLLLVLAVLLVREARWPPRRTTAWAVARGLPCDPGDLDLPFEAWTLDRPDDVRLPVWEIGTSTGSRRDDESTPLTVVLVHGWGQSRIAMLGRLSPWRDMASRLVLYDLRGHGDAEGGPSRLGAGEHDDLLALLDGLGDGRFVLVGHSMGAVIALEAAAADASRQRIAGVVAYGPYDDFHHSLQGRLRVASLPVRPITDLAMLGLRLLGVRHTPTRRAAGGLRCPLLVVHGEEDAVSPPAAVERVAAAATNATVLRLAGAAHSDTHEIDPASHDRVVREFVRSLPDLRDPELEA